MGRYSNTRCGLMEMARANEDSVAILTEVLEELEVRRTTVRGLLEAARDRQANERFEWPTTDAPAATHGFSGDFFFYEKGLLKFVGYGVGVSGDIQSVRRRVLDCVFHKKLPRVESPEYMSEWGEPETSPRLQKMAESLAAFTRNAKRQTRRDYSLAISEWEADLKYLYDTYYVGHFDFAWPITDIL